MSLRESTVNEDMLGEFECTRATVSRVYEPKEVSVVLGAGGKQSELHMENLSSDNVPILHRKGGGGIVVLSPGQVVLAVVAEVPFSFKNNEYCLEINAWIRAALGSLGVTGVQDKGICDLAINNLKILGGSAYRRREIFFYQACILVNNDLRLFSRYLKMPRIAPEYRQGRTHDQFCTNLHEQGYATTPSQLAFELNSVMKVRTL